MLYSFIRTGNICYWNKRKSIFIMKLVFDKSLNKRQSCDSNSICSKFTTEVSLPWTKLSFRSIFWNSWLRKRHILYMIQENSIHSIAVLIMLTGFLINLSCELDHWDQLELANEALTIRNIVWFLSFICNCTTLR